MPWALSLARPRAGSNRAARIAMMAMTTSSSIKVNPRRRTERRRNAPARLSDASFMILDCCAIIHLCCVLCRRRLWVRHAPLKDAARKSFAQPHRQTQGVGGDGGESNRVEAVFFHSHSSALHKFPSGARAVFKPALGGHAALTGASVIEPIDVRFANRARFAKAPLKPFACAAMRPPEIG